MSHATRHKAHDGSKKGRAKLDMTHVSGLYMGVERMHWRDGLPLS